MATRLATRTQSDKNSDPKTGAELGAVSEPSTSSPISQK
jgi:hypothetical protein